MVNGVKIKGSSLRDLYNAIKKSSSIQAMLIYYPGRSRTCRLLPALLLVSMFTLLAISPTADGDNAKPTDIAKGSAASKAPVRITAITRNPGPSDNTLQLAKGKTALLPIV